MRYWRENVACGIAIVGVCATWVLFVNFVVLKVDAMPKKIDPISPDDVALEKGRRLPDAVIRSFNEMIAETWDGECSKFEQDLVVARIMSHLNMEPAERPKIFQMGWLNVEPVYDRSGWTVLYDKPEPGCINSVPMFTFTPKPKEE